MKDTGICAAIVITAAAAGGFSFYESNIMLLAALVGILAAGATLALLTKVET